MSFEDNEVYCNGVRVASAEALPENAVVQFSAVSRRNVVRLQDVDGSGRVRVDLRDAVGCEFVLGSNNVVDDGELSVIFPAEAGRPTVGSFVRLGHANTFAASATLQAPSAPGTGISIGSRNVIGQGFSIRSGGPAIFDIATGGRSNPEAGSAIGSRNWFGDRVTVLDRGSVGSDSVLALGTTVGSDWSGAGHMVLEGSPARVISDGVSWAQGLHHSVLGSVPAPILTVGVTTYERPQTVRRAIASILNQELPSGVEVEVLIVDDGSESEAFKELWVELKDLPRADSFSVQGLRNAESTGGPSAGRNAVIDMARGSHIMFLDDDDQFAEGALAPLVEYLASSDAQRVSLRHRRGDRSVFLAPAVWHENLDIIDSLWTMLALSAYRTSDIRRYRSGFPAGVHYGEDSEFVLHFTVRSEQFSSMCDRDYVVLGDPVAGESAHLSQGKGSWEGFLSGIISHLERFGGIIRDSGLPAYDRDRLAVKAILSRSVASYQMLRRLGELNDIDLAGNLLGAYSAVINSGISQPAIMRFAREHSLEREITAVVANDLAALRAARAPAEVAK